MCGIFGGFDRRGDQFGNDLARVACERMRHRGPDDEGIAESDGVLICNRRLSILDLGGGHQPMFSDDGQISVVQNGEIYNFLELARGLNCRTKCDTEVILRLYERDGENFIHQLNGMFAIAIFDRRHRKLLLYRDRTGQKPLYIHDDGNRMMFASEIKSLLGAGVPAEVDQEALDAYLTYNFVPPPATLFRGIRHLMPGHRLTIEEQGIREEKWWELPQNSEADRHESDWQDEIIETLKDAIRVRLRADVPLGAFLSGGIDSSAVVKLMSEQLERRVQTFCIGFDDPRFDESKFAQSVADLCNSDHTCRVMHPGMLDNWPLATYHNDQPHGDMSFVPTYQVSRLAREHVKVVLTGDGGDELFAGYDVHRKFFSDFDPTQSQSEFERSFVKAISLFSHNEKQSIYSSTLRRELAESDPMQFAEPLFCPLRQHDKINQALGLDVKLLLPGNNLVKPDKMAMAVSLEPRAPFLDYRMVELAFRIPGTMKLSNGVTKRILKKALERHLPHDIIYRKKQMFTVPIGEWFKRELKPWVEDLLFSKRFDDRGIFDSTGVREMVANHAAGSHNYTRQIRAMIALELWHRVFVDAQFDHAPNYEELGLKSPVTTPSDLSKDRNAA